LAFEKNKLLFESTDYIFKRIQERSTDPEKEAEKIQLNFDKKDEKKDKANEWEKGTSLDPKNFDDKGNFKRTES